MAFLLQETTNVVADLDRAVELYTNLLGFEVRHRQDWGLVVLAQGERLLVLRTASSFESEFPEYGTDRRPRVNFESTDIEADAEKLRAAGLKVSNITGTPGSWRALLFFDLDDNPFFVWSCPK